MPLSNVNPDNYQLQLERKAERIRKDFSIFNPPNIDIYDSPPLYYRMRAEFKIWHEGDDSYYVMFRADDKKNPIRIDNFPIGSLKINQLMTAIMTCVKKSLILRHKLFQIEFLTTLSGEALVTMIYHKKLKDDWKEQALEIQKQLDIIIIGRSKKQKLVLKDDFVTEQLTVDRTTYQFQQVEGSFTQPNASINQKMLSWALDATHSTTDDDAGDLLELYCGNGNFTVVLAQNFNRVLATEISKTSVKSALHNFQINRIENAKVVRMSSEEFSSALAGEREYRRLKDIELDQYQFSTVLVDPPRAGLDALTLELISQFKTIVYISCNPNTLHDNLLQLSKTHAVEKMAIFDQFPYTDHIECGVILNRNKQSET